MMITSLYKMLKKRINKYLEIHEYRKVSVEALHRMLDEQLETEWTKKILDAKMHHLRPTRNPIVLIYRRIRDRRGEYMNRHHLLSVATKLHAQHVWITAELIRDYISTHYHIIKTTDEVTADLRSFYQEIRTDDVIFEFRTTDNRTEFQIRQHR